MPVPHHAAVERLGSALAQAGVPRLPARVFAALMADDDGRMTSAELVSGLAVSAAGVSGAVAYLERLGLLRRERERGSRRDVYVVDEDAWHAAMMRHDQTHGPIRAAFDEAMSALDDGSPAHRRLALSRDFLDFLEEELDAIGARWETRKAELGR